MWLEKQLISKGHGQNMFPVLVVNVRTALVENINVKSKHLTCTRERTTRLIKNVYINLAFRISEKKIIKYFKYKE